MIEIEVTLTCLKDEEVKDLYGLRAMRIIPPKKQMLNLQRNSLNV